MSRWPSPVLIYSQQLECHQTKCVKCESNIYVIADKIYLAHFCFWNMHSRHSNALLIELKFFFNGEPEFTGFVCTRIPTNLTDEEDYLRKQTLMYDLTPTYSWTNVLREQPEKTLLHHNSYNQLPSNFFLSPPFHAGRGRGGRGGYKDDRRDRYGGGRGNFGGSGYRDTDRGFGGGPKTAFGGSKAQNSGNYVGNSGNSSGSYGNNYNSNGQGSFGAPNQGGFGNQSFQAPPQFGGMQRPAQNGMSHAPFPFNSQPPPPPQTQQPPPPPPMVPYPMPPPFQQ